MDKVRERMQLSKVDLKKFLYSVRKSYPDFGDCYSDPHM